MPFLYVALYGSEQSSQLAFGLLWIGKHSIADISVLVECKLINHPDPISIYGKSHKAYCYYRNIRKLKPRVFVGRLKIYAKLVYMSVELPERYGRGLLDKTLHSPFTHHYIFVPDSLIKSDLAECRIYVSVYIIMIYVDVDIDNMQDLQSRCTRQLIHIIM